MKRHSILYLATLVLSSPSLAFDLPEIICYIQGTPVDSTRFGRDFCWVGDQNGDGYDDLLVDHDPLTHAFAELRNSANQVELFYGGEEMDDEPDMLFTIDEDWYGIGDAINYLGNILPDRGDYLAIQAYYHEAGLRPSERYIYIYEGGDELDEEHEFEIHRTSGRYEDEHAIYLTNSHRSRPADINGDGYDDWGIYFVEPGERRYYDGYYVFFGGEDPDLKPDIELEGNHSILHFAGDISGGDFNGDGYGDIVTSNRGGYYNYGEVHLYFGRPRLPEFMEADIEMDGEHDFDEERFRMMGHLVGAIGDYNGDGADRQQ